MEGLCRAFDKTEGLLLRHSILSFSPEERIDAWDAADIATRAIRYYEQQYQILAAVHEDRPHIHIHFVMNTLNYRTGKKYPGDRADYYGFLAYLAIILALLTSYFLKHTRPGLHLRSVGESASTADAAGINVTRYKYLATCIGSMIAGLGGLYYVMDYASGVWSNNAFGDRGWLAIALVIFTIWRPNVSVLASILFGGLYILYLYIPTGTQMAVKELYKMLPYVVTVVVLVISSLRNNKEKQPPASLGLSYFREER